MRYRGEWRRFARAARRTDRLGRVLRAFEGLADLLSGRPVETPGAPRRKRRKEAARRHLERSLESDGPSSGRPSTRNDYYLLQARRALSEKDRETVARHGLALASLRPLVGIHDPGRRGEAIRCAALHDLDTGEIRWLARLCCNGLRDSLERSLRALLPGRRRLTALAHELAEALEALEVDDLRILGELEGGAGGPL